MHVTLHLCACPAFNDVSGYEVAPNFAGHDDARGANGTCDAAACADHNHTMLGVDVTHNMTVNAHAKLVYQHIAVDSEVMAHH